MRIVRPIQVLAGFASLFAFVFAIALAVAAPAWAGSATTPDDPAAFVAAPSARAQQNAIDAYLASAKSDATLVGGPGDAGYDGGFWIRGGAFLLKVNLTIQTRYEAFLWSDKATEPAPGGDLSGWSLPRLTLKLSGDACCCVHYYAQLEFGHAAAVSTMPMEPGMPMMFMPGMVEFLSDPGTMREAWIEYEACPAVAVRMGLVQTASTRQLMTPPEMQQFVDVSLAAASVGMMMPGYTDRNRDYGVAVHGVLGCRREWSYLATVTNGDGPVKRNVLDGMTNDNLAYSARVNWDFLGPSMGYDECAIGQSQGEWSASVGAWAHDYTFVVSDHPHVSAGDWLSVGADARVGWGGFSACAAYTYGQVRNADPGFDDQTSHCWCVQAGYLFCGTAWEIAARYSNIDMKVVGMMPMHTGAHEFGFAVNYFIDGHADKLTADVSFVSGDADGNEFGDVYAGYQPTLKGDGTLIRFQWQLAL